MKSYSKADVLGEETWTYEGKMNWLDRIAYKLNKVTPIVFRIEVPLNIYLRAEIICEDIEELAETSFNQNDLLNLLYNEFLFYVKESQDINMVFKMLTSLEIGAHNKDQKTESLLIIMRRKHALRGEVLLADLDEVYTDHGFTLERVFELLYCDFVDKLRKGLSPDAVNKILSSLLDDGE